MRFRSRKSLALLLLGGTGLLLLMVFLLLGPPQLLAKSEHPTFCAGCHVMEAEYDAWAHAGAHRRRACVDCHLPNDNTVSHYVWKAIDGMKDISLFYSGAVRDHITITEHGKEVLQANCIRCHEQTVMNISQGRQCWDCHRRVMHTRSGALQTI